MEFCRIPKKPKVFWNLIPKHQKRMFFFLEFQSKFQKKHMVFKGFLPKFQKNLGFFLEFSKIPKKPRVFQNSKRIINLPKYFWNFGILENSSFFCNFVEFQKKHMVFSRFSTKISKKPWVFFWNFPKFQKKPRVFQNSKIPKKLSTCPNIWNFGKLEVFLEFCRIPKKTKVFSGFLRFPKFKNSKKNYQLAQIFLEFWNFGKLKVFFAIL